jgi:hypothetical protein
VAKRLKRTWLWPLFEQGHTPERAWAYANARSLEDPAFYIQWSYLLKLHRDWLKSKENPR